MFKEKKRYNVLLTYLMLWKIETCYRVLSFVDKCLGCCLFPNCENYLVLYLYNIFVHVLIQICWHFSCIIHFYACMYAECRYSNLEENKMMITWCNLDVLSAKYFFLLWTVAVDSDKMEENKLPIHLNSSQYARCYILPIEHQIYVC